MFFKDPKNPGVVPFYQAFLYRLDAGGKCTTVLDKVTLSNGLDWTEDDKTFYYNDSWEHKLQAFDFDPATGSLTNRRCIFDSKASNVASEDAIMDGMSLDTRGNLWIALFKGSKVQTTMALPK